MATSHLLGLDGTLGRSLQSKWSLPAILRVVWVSLVLWFELGEFYVSMWSCRWPEPHRTNHWQLQSSSSTHVLLLSDPRVRPIFDSRGWLDDIRQFLYHLALKKNWRFAVTKTPDAIIFLGDMLASGYQMRNDDQYVSYYQRFKDLFQYGDHSRIHYVPGNDDVGLRTDLKLSRMARSRYAQHFGPVNQQLSISNHTIVIIDSPGLVEEDYQRAGEGLEYDEWQPKSGGTIEFINQFGKAPRTQPTILFTHIPLARPDSASCGPLRDKGSIRRGVGAGYQNTLGKQTTHFLLQEIQPAGVFSGDDRDYCEYNHRQSHAHPGSSSLSAIREVTVKSFSPFKHIRKPGFHLLSLSNPLNNSNQPSFADTPCLLPDHLGSYTAKYFPLTIITFIFLLAIRFRRFGHHRKPSLPSWRGERLSPPDLSDVTWMSPTQEDPLLSPSRFMWFPRSPGPSPPSTVRTPSLTLPEDEKHQESIMKSRPTISRTSSAMKTYRASLTSSTSLDPTFMSSSDDEDERSSQSSASYINTPSSLTHTQPLHVKFHDYDHGDEDDFVSADNPNSAATDVTITTGSYFSPTVDIHPSLKRRPSSFFGSSPTSSSSPDPRRRWWKWWFDFSLLGYRRRLTIRLPPLWRLSFWASYFPSAASGGDDGKISKALGDQAGYRAQWMKMVSGRKRSRLYYVLKGAVKDFVKVMVFPIGLWALMTAWTWYS